MRGRPLACGEARVWSGVDYDRLPVGAGRAGGGQGRIGVGTVHCRDGEAVPVIPAHNPVELSF